MCAGRRRKVKKKGKKKFDRRNLKWTFSYSPQILLSVLLLIVRVGNKSSDSPGRVSAVFPLVNFQKRLHRVALLMSLRFFASFFVHLSIFLTL